MISGAMAAAVAVGIRTDAIRIALNGIRERHCCTAEDNELPRPLSSESNVRSEVPDVTITEANARQTDRPITFADDRVEVSGSRFLSVALTPEAEAAGMPLALPELVNMRSESRLLWRPRQVPGTY